MTRKGAPARRVYLRSGRWYFVDLKGKWHALTKERDGLPAMYRALAALTDAELNSDRMPAVVSRWVQSKIDAGDWTDGTQVDVERAADRISKRFADFRPSDVTTPRCAEYLRDYIKQPRTHNLHRSVIRQVMAFAAREGLREGFNPVDNIPTRAMRPRRRIVSDAEVAAIKLAAGSATRGALCLAIDLALASGQRIGDVLKMRWQDAEDEGLRVKQQKTGAEILIEWTPELRRAVEACATGDRIGYLLKKSTGVGYRYAGIRSAWVRACEKAGVQDLHIHDLRGRAGADRKAAAGIEAAQDLLGHESVTMTEGYVRGKAPRRAKAPK